MHKFHHHYKAPWTDSNFGNLFSFWDRLFGTLVYDDPKKVKYADSKKEVQNNDLRQILTATLSTRSRQA